MRLIERILTASEKTKIKQLSAQFDMEDVELVEDIYAMLCDKCSLGVMSASEISKQCAALSAVDRGLAQSNALQKRELLLKMGELKYFQYISTHYPPEVSLGRLLAFFRMLYPKLKAMRQHMDNLSREQAAKLTATVLFADMVVLLTFLADPITSQAVLGKKGQNDEAVTGMMNITVAGCGIGKTGGVFDATFSGISEERLNRYEHFVQTLSDADLQVFKLASNFENVLGYIAGSEYEKSPLPEDENDIQQMREISDVFKADPSQLAKHTKESLAVALQNRDLIITEQLREVKKDQLLYFLVDVSGSMQEGIGTNQYNLLSRGDLASCVSLVFLKHSQTRNNLFFLRFFADGTNDLIVGDTPESYVHTARMIGLADYNGGGTEILRAVGTAVKDIKARLAHDRIEKAEIVLITDCESILSEEDMVRVADGVPVHTIDISPSVNKFTEILKACSTKYHKIDLNKDDLEADIINTVL